MGQAECWVVEDGVFRHSASFVRNFASLVALHTHSCYSKENLASLNCVFDLAYMRPFKGLLRQAFGLGGMPNVDYTQLCYHPPYRPDEIWRMEAANVRRLGVERLLLAITDHDEIAGAVELLRQHPDRANHIALGEELSIRFQGHVFHLGVSGLPADRVEETHASLWASARRDDLDAVFDELASLGCLVVLNHPLICWSSNGTGAPLALHLVSRYGWAIDALELNAMRSHDENRAVIELARRVGKPLVGGGDSHLLLASSALCASRATTYSDFIAEVKSGWSCPVVTGEYFSSQRWKLSLRVLSFMTQYRRIAEFRGQPVRTMLDGRWVLLDPLGHAAGGVLTLLDRLGLLS